MKNNLKIYNALNIVIASLFLFYVVLLFVLFATPAVILPLGENNTKNVYSLYINADIPELEDIMFIIIMFAVFTLSYSLCVLVLKICPQLSKSASVIDTLLSLSIVVLYCVFLTISCIVLYKFNELEYCGLPLTAGVSLILIIIFSVLFIFISIGVIIAQYVSKKKFYQY